MYYQAGESTSYESMRFIITKVPFGWLVRSIHCWTAHLMIMSLLLHMWSVFFLHAYRKPRELTWFTGFGLFGLALGFGFSGYLLPWNELSYFATAVGTDSVKAVPVVGEWMLRVMRGGDEVSIRTLYRFFALHVCSAAARDAWASSACHLLFDPEAGHGPAARCPIPNARRRRRPSTAGCRSSPTSRCATCCSGSVPERAGAAGGVAALRPRHPAASSGSSASRPTLAEAGVPGHQARVVLPLDVPAAQGVPGPHLRHGGPAGLSGSSRRC